jgi:peptidoglycan/xylan/chitin deacetylase (PgdA/CDA1 family)
MFSPLAFLAAALPLLVHAQAPANASASVPASVPVTNISVSLLSENPTAVPILSINAVEPSSPTIGLGWTTTPAAGTVPTDVSGAPALPNIGSLLPANYPPLDKVPDITTPQVQQWIAEVQATGVQIPDISQNNLGGCPNNTAAAADQTRCWWTCGGCVRDTDITTCPDKLTWGLTYDDGPAPYTPNLLQYLDQNDLKTTFFVVGSRAISYPSVLQTEYISDHQIAVHTWSHPSLTTLSNEQIIAELGWSKKVIKDILGVTPNMMRPPYGDIDDRVRAISLAMGLTPVIWTRISPQATFDTGDFNVAGGTVSSEQVLQNWEYILGNATTIDTGFIVLEHDLFLQSVELAIGYILPDALAHNNPSFDIKPVITCLNKPMQDAYIETNNNQSNPQPANSPSVPATALPSGASGSVQATGGSSSSHKNSAAGRINTGIVDCAILGIIAGIACVFF